MIVSPLTAVVLELPWDCRQSNLSSASALGAINQLQQGMNFHSENNFKASECKEVWKYQRKAFTYTASAWTPNHWIVRKSGFTLPSALHLGFIFSQKAFFSRSSHSKEKANWGLGYCWTWWITSSLSQRAGGGSLPQRCSVQVCQTGSCQWKEKGFTENEQSYLQLSDLPSVKRLFHHVSAHSLINQPINQSAESGCLLNLLPLDGVNSYWNICCTITDFRICRRKVTNQGCLNWISLPLEDVYIIKQVHLTQQPKEIFVFPFSL